MIDESKRMLQIQNEVEEEGEIWSYVVSWKIKMKGLKLRPPVLLCANSFEEKREREREMSHCK